MFLALAICTGFAMETRGVESGQRYERLVIRNVFLIDGKGTPMRGPVDIILQGNKIHSVRSALFQTEPCQSWLLFLELDHHR